MPDWSGEIRRRLSAVRLPPEREAAIVDELAQHLEDRYQTLLASGQPADEAAEVAVAAEPVAPAAAAQETGHQPAPAATNGEAEATKAPAKAPAASTAPPAAPPARASDAEPAPAATGE